MATGDDVAVFPALDALVTRMESGLAQLEEQQDPRLFHETCLRPRAPWAPSSGAADSVTRLGRTLGRGFGVTLPTRKETGNHGPGIQPQGGTTR